MTNKNEEIVTINVPSFEDCDLPYEAYVRLVLHELVENELKRIGVLKDFTIKLVFVK